MTALVAAIAWPMLSALPSCGTSASHTESMAQQVCAEACAKQLECSEAGAASVNCDTLCTSLQTQSQSVAIAGCDLQTYLGLEEACVQGACEELAGCQQHAAAMCGGVPDASAEAEVEASMEDVAEQDASEEEDGEASTATDDCESCYNAQKCCQAANGAASMCDAFEKGTCETYYGNYDVNPVQYTTYVTACQSEVSAVMEIGTIQGCQ